MGSEYENVDEGGAEPKPVRWAKGKKKRATVHAHVEAHIPMVLAPTTPRLMAADLSNTKIWDEEQLQKLRQNWAWVNGVPEHPATGKLEYLKLLANLGIDSAKLDMVKKELSALKKPMTEMISKATDLLHQADLGFRAVVAMNGGPKMSTDDQAALGAMARLNAFQGESMLSSPAKTVAEKIKEQLCECLVFRVACRGLEGRASVFAHRGAALDVGGGGIDGC